MNILFIGSSGVLSLFPLIVLIEKNHAFCALATNEENSGVLSSITPNTLQSIAFENSIPLINLNNDASDIIKEIEQYQPDVILVSCYPRLIPHNILSKAKFGSFNLHPSLLPKFRGPNPIFWQFREGICDYGVTLHRMDSEFDKGNIVSQQKIKVHDGIHMQEAIKLIANVGSQLILDFLKDLNEDKTNEIAQDESVSSYQSYPIINDYRIDTAWTAKRIYNFIKAYHEPNVFFLCEIDGRDYKLVNALSYQTNAYAEMAGDKCVVAGDTITFSCGDGYIQCKFKAV